MILNSKRLKDERNKTEKFENDYEQIVGSSCHETEEDETLAS